MTRVELGGEGFPIPTVALPDDLLTEDVIAPVTLVLEDGTDFAKADFVGLGYTNFEVWCIGAAGGRGGSGAGYYPRWRYTKTREVMPEPYWTDYLIASRDPTVPVDHKYILTRREPPYDEMALTSDELHEYLNPTHEFDIFTYHDPDFVDNPALMGGGGGGGGLHVVSGLLADLPALVPVVVGQAGADAPAAQSQIPGAYDANPYKNVFAPYPAALPSARRPTYTYTWFTQRYPTTALLPPEPGEDGEASSFGTVCKASGGKGGLGAIEWIGGVQFFAAYGGDGGAGGSLVAGGGGAGSMSSEKNGKDGTWNGIIGKGGGGGRGGRYISATPADGSLMHMSPVGYGPPPAVPPAIKNATNGGQGSFSYGDTSVFGQRGFRSNYIGAQIAYDPETGAPLTQIPKPTDYSVVAGGGGGAKAPGKRWHGSRAQGYSPNGLVLIKIYKI